MRRRNPIVISDAHSSNRPSIRRIAHVIERIGLAIVGALCGLFVTALVTKANVDLLNPVGLAFATILYGVIGFYVGIDIPRPPSGTLSIDLSNVWLGPTANLVELLSAVGIFLAAMAALVSVYAVMFDEVVSAIWMVAVGASWLIGVGMQVTAGVIGHIRERDHIIS
jgi:hypothetical protein